MLTINTIKKPILLRILSQTSLINLRLVKILKQRNLIVNNGVLKKRKLKRMIRLVILLKYLNEISLNLHHQKRLHVRKFIKVKLRLVQKAPQNNMI